MAIHTDARGFEAPPAGLDPDLVDFGASTPIDDGTAWSGLRYLHVERAAPLAPGGVSYPAATLPIPAAGQLFDYRATIYFRLKAWPDVNNVYVCGMFTNCQLEMSTGGRLRMKGPTSLIASPYSTEFLTPDPTIWYRLEVRHYGIAKASAKSNSGRSRSTAQIFRAVGGAFLFQVSSPIQAGAGCSVTGDTPSPDGSCSAATGGIMPFAREVVNDGTASFLAMQPLGLQFVTVSWVSGGTADAPLQAGDYNLFVSDTQMARVSGCYRGAYGAAYTYVEHGNFTQFNEDFSVFTIDDGLTADTFFLGQDNSGPVSTRNFDYDATFVVGATGADIPPNPPAPPGPPPNGCAIPQPAPESGASCVIPYF